MERKTKISRKTFETDINIQLNIDGNGKYDINTGVSFFNHMLESFTKHGFFDLMIKAIGDIDVDDHHTIEDVGILMGEGFLEVLSNKKGIKRIAHSIVPMDESLAIVAIDISGRPYTKLDFNFKNEKIGDLTSDNINHFIETFSSYSKINIHVKAEGSNDHHKCEAIFKALGISLKEASRIENDMIPSTKGLL